MAKKTKKSTLKKHYSFPLWQIVVFVGLFASIGVYSLTQSYASPKRGGGGSTNSGTLKVEVVASTSTPGAARYHITGCGYSPNAYVTQYNQKYLDAADGWGSFGSLPVGSNGCIDYYGSDNGGIGNATGLRPGNYTAYVTQSFLRKGSSGSAQTVASTTFVVSSNGLTQ